MSEDKKPESSNQPTNQANSNGQKKEAPKKVERPRITGIVEKSLNESKIFEKNRGTKLED